MKAFAQNPEQRRNASADLRRSTVATPGPSLPRFGHDFSCIPAHAATETAPAQGAADPCNLRERYLKGDHQEAVRIVRANKGPGLALPPDVHNRVREHVDHDFSHVHIHTDAFARRAAASLEANAFTVSSDIFFGANMYAPDQPKGIRRLAHELIHTIQQHDTAATPTIQQICDLEHQAEFAALGGIRGSQLLATGPCILREPTFPRATTEDDTEKEVSRVLSLNRDMKSKDETTRLWSQVKSNFPKTVTAGSLARNVWTNLFFKHFVEPDQKEGAVESAHPRYFFSRKYGWIDGQHFFGFIDFAEQFHRAAPKKPQKAFDKATKKGSKIEETQWKVNRLMDDRDPSTMAQDYAGTAEDWMKEEEKRDRNELGAQFDVLTEMASPYATSGMNASNPVFEVFNLLNDKQKEKFWIDMAKSAFTYEDFESNQLGTRFYFQYGIKINSLPEDQRASAFQSDLKRFFKEIEVENDPKAVAKLAKSLPGKERFNAPKTTEEKVRGQHPDLFKLP